MARISSIGVAAPPCIKTRCSKKKLQIEGNVCNDNNAIMINYIRQIFNEYYSAENAGKILIHLQKIFFLRLFSMFIIHIITILK